MEEKVNINERLYEQIKEHCNKNNISVKDYITRIIEEKFYTDKYGDLNIIRNGILGVDKSEFIVKKCELIPPDKCKVIFEKGDEVIVECANITTNEVPKVIENIKQDTEDKLGDKKVIVKRKIQSK